mmetsp:Transcript_17697/g.28972  ORF Transcript_17697/g.28972 Transcript_17697/m.28972 type:complete len:119 (+) Transcript_17697:66-422(+)
MLCPLDVHGAHHHGHQAFVSTPIIIDTAIKQQYRVRRSSRLEYSKDHENDINIWLPTEHIASATASSNIAKTSHGWDNFPTSIDNTADSMIILSFTNNDAYVRLSTRLAEVGSTWSCW